MSGTMSTHSPIVVQLCRSLQDDFNLANLPLRSDIKVLTCLTADQCISQIRKEMVNAVILDLENPAATGLALRVHLEEAGKRPIMGLIATEYPDFIKGWAKSFWIPMPIRVSAAIERIELFIDLHLAERKIERLSIELETEQIRTDNALKRVDALGRGTEQQVLERTRGIAAQNQEGQHQVYSQDLSRHPFLREPFVHEMINALPVMVYFKDSKSRFVYLNRQLAAFLNKDVDEVLGRQAEKLPSPYAELFDYKTDLEALANPQGISFERRVHLNGKMKTLFLGKQPFVIEGVEEPYLLGYGIDLSDQKVMEEKFSQTQKLEALGTMAGGIAHDFNNLLFAMLLNLSLIQKAVPGAKKDHYIAQMRQACERAKDMTSQILTFSKQQKHRIEPIDITLILDEVYSLSRSVTSKNIRFEHSYRCLNPRCLADPSQIHQVLMNLVNNAAYSLKKSGGHISVTLVDWEVADGDPMAQDLKPGKYLKIGVQDNGPGIAPEIIPRIFDPFFSTKPTDEGTGLGLSVAQGIIQRHQGWIKVSSSVAQGTRFDVYLPQTEISLARADQRPLPLDIGQTVGPRKRLVIVDDETLVLEPLCDFLQDEGFGLVAFDNPRLALDYCLKHIDDIDLILSDQNMPELTGLSFCKQISLKRPGLPLILYSGYSEQLTLECSIEAGASLLLSKPLDQDELLRAIKQLLA